MFKQVQFNLQLLTMQQDSRHFRLFQQSQSQKPRHDYHNFPLNFGFSATSQKNTGPQRDNLNKHKGINKKLPQKKIRQKRKKDVTLNTIMGRPNNGSLQKEHLRISKSFNDVIYHFSRMMIFLMLQKGDQTSLHALQLQNYQAEWMNQAEYIMSLQNFPAYEEEKPSFLLHPNSLHYAFQYLRKMEGKQAYYQQEIKYMLLAFLKRRKMLTSEIYEYVNSYWADIIHLINNPEGNEQEQCEEIEQMREIKNFSSLQFFNNENLNRNNLIQTSQGNQRSQQRRKAKNQNSELQLLKRQLKDDPTIAAYQIACYLYACRVKFQINIEVGF